ncbi:MAG TPA: DHA2 family efflux MFS transporter permease subunit [Aquabacterium sp.]|nr:DHA2 family efflux MFS transporter permease subunit [Aquabacterium sp.]
MTQQPLHGASLFLLTVGLSLGTFMQVLDTSIANVSLPAISGDLAVSPNQGTWVITSFAVSNAITLPLTGWLSRRFGDARLFVVSTLLFTLASWLCGLSPSLPTLIVARVIQGAVAGPMIPLSQSLLLNNYPPEKRGLALALWSMTVIVAPILGPIMGGWITDNISWPWIFFINLPVGMLSAFVTWTILGKRSSATQVVPIDTVGLVLLVLGVGALQILLDKGNELDWFESRAIVALAVTSAIALSVLVVWELTDRHPVVDFHLFGQRNFLVGTVILSFGYLVFFGNVVILPLWLQTNMGYTATWAGLAAAPIGILPVFLSALVGKYMDKIDLRYWATFSFGVFAAVSFWNSSFNTDVTFQQIVIPRLLMGFGVATFFVPLTALTLSGIPPHMLSSATGLSNFSRILAGSFGTSLSITLWDRRAAFHHTILTSHVSAFDPTVADALGGLANPVTDPAMLERIISQQAVLLATNDIFRLSGAFFVALMLMVWLAKPPKRHPIPAAGGAH